MSIKAASTFAVSGGRRSLLQDLRELTQAKGASPSFYVADWAGT